MAAPRDGNMHINLLAVNLLREGMKRICRQKGDFARSVATWRLHLRLGKVLGKSHLPPPDYVRARMDDDPEQLAERLWDQESARQLQKWHRVAQIKREFANIQAFENLYGSIIDTFKESGRKPSQPGRSRSHLRSMLLLVCGCLWFLLAPPAQAAPDADGSVVATIMPLHSLVSGTMAGFAKPVLLLPGASSPHTYALRPSDVRSLEKARLIVRAGKDLETFLERPLTTLAARSRILSLLELPGVHLLPGRRGGSWESHHHEAQGGGASPDLKNGSGHPHDPRDGHDFLHDQAHTTGLDPHLWLDPDNARILIVALVDLLGEIWPEQKNLFAENGRLQQERLRQLDSKLRELLHPLQGHPFIVFHDAYQYFEVRYGVKGVGSMALHPEQPPGARRIVELHQQIRRSGVACLFSEPQFRSDRVQGLFKDFGLRYGILDPLGSDLAPGPDAYFRMMENLALSLRRCLLPAGNASGSGEPAPWTPMRF
ncbi:MAG: zinc ABC transporter substrate-binding protein [Magnetococcales bacterium]|nr:zinc ABC transporter substrate-binding protein [Magnetococcales bacterium]